MTKTRDIIREIDDVRSRRHFGVAMAELPSRLIALEIAFESHDESNEELARYFPVAIIACIEAYFRMAITELVDIGEPFLSNAESTSTSVRLDFTLMRAVHGRAITVGELVAHGIPLSRLEHIDSVLSAILGKGFLEGLRSVIDRYSHEVMGKPATPILQDPDAIFASVARAFELRHIICHEIASEFPATTDEIAGCFKDCVLFLRAAAELISEAMYPGAPLTQADMNVRAGDSLQAVEERLAAAVGTLRDRLEPAEVTSFDTAQAHWRAYCDAWAHFVAGPRESSGTMWPVIYAGAAQDLVEKRLDEIENYHRLGEQGW